VSLASSLLLERGVTKLLCTSAISRPSRASTRFACYRQDGRYCCTHGSIYKFLSPTKVKLGRSAGQVRLTTFHSSGTPSVVVRYVNTNAQ